MCFIAPPHARGVRTGRVPLHRRITHLRHHCSFMSQTKPGAADESAPRSTASKAIRIKPEAITTSHKKTASHVPQPTKCQRSPPVAAMAAQEREREREREREGLLHAERAVAIHDFRAQQCSVVALSGTTRAAELACPSTAQRSQGTVSAAHCRRARAPGSSAASRRQDRPLERPPPVACASPSWRALCP